MDYGRIRKDKYWLRNNKYGFKSIFLIFISFFGLFLLIAMYLWSPPLKTYYILQESLILLIYTVICILGMFAAIYPSYCQGLIKFQNKFNIDSLDSNNLISNSPDNINIKFEGHHPDCGRFKHHIFNIRGRKYCPGCSGLFIGATIAVVGTLLYFVSLTLGISAPYVQISLYGQIFFPLGVVMVLLALCMIVFLNMKKELKFTANLVLVLGSFLMLIGIVEVKANLLIEIYFIILVLFWILTRIIISESYHEKICYDCQKESICIYE